MHPRAQSPLLSVTLPQVQHGHPLRDSHFANRRPGRPFSWVSRQGAAAFLRVVRHSLCLTSPGVASGPRRRHHDGGFRGCQGHDAIVGSMLSGSALPQIKERDSIMKLFLPFREMPARVKFSPPDTRAHVCNQPNDSTIYSEGPKIIRIANLNSEFARNTHQRPPAATPPAAALPAMPGVVRCTADTPSMNLVRKRTLALLNMPSFRETMMNWEFLKCVLSLMNV